MDTPVQPVNVKDELEWVKDMLSVDRFDDAEKALLKVLKVLAPARVCDLPGVHQSRHGQALRLLGLRLQGVVQGLGHFKSAVAALAQGLGLLGCIAHLGG